MLRDKCLRGFNQRKYVKYWRKRTIGFRRPFWTPDEALEPQDEAIHLRRAQLAIHIIDLSKTLTQLEAACDFLGVTVRKGGKVIFVGTKKQAQQCVKDTAKECGQFYVTERWLGGTLTNFNTIKTSIKTPQGDREDGHRRLARRVRQAGSRR